MSMEYIFPLIWILGVAFYIDEMTMHFKVLHADKQILAYISEGDELQTYYLCHKGEIYQYLCAIIIHQKHFDKKICPHFMLE